MSQSVGQTPWTAGGLRIFASALAAVERAALSAYARGEEACGYLTGPAAAPLVADKAVELENLANRYHQVDPLAHPRTGREYFKINSLRFERAVEAARAAGEPVKVFFHSHVDADAYFSEEDAASFTMGGTAAPPHPLAYLVSSVHAGAVGEHRLFVWVDATRTFDPADFTVEP